MKIDSKDLCQLKEIKEFTNSKGIFYRKESSGEYSMCKVPERMSDDELNWEYFKLLTQQFLKEGRLFVSRNSPFRAISV